MVNPLRLLKTQRFLPLFIVQFLGALNDNVFKNAFLIWYTYKGQSFSSISAPIMATLASGLFILPFFLFSSTAGQLGDKYEKSWLAIKIKQVEIVLMIAGGLCFYLNYVPGLLLVLFLLGAQSTFFGPIKFSLLPEHLQSDELVAGNGLIGAGTFIAILLGTIIGGILILSTNGVAIIATLLFIAALIGWLFSRYIPGSKACDTSLQINFNLLKETKKNIQYARSNQLVFFAILNISWFWLIGITFLTQVPIYTKEVIQGNAAVVTFFLTVFSIGVGIGSMLSHRLLKGAIDKSLLPYSSLGMTIGIVCFILSSYAYVSLYPEIATLLGFWDFMQTGAYAWIICLSFLCIAICGGVYSIPLYAIIQHYTSLQFTSRVIAANNVLNAFFMVLGSLGALLLYALNFTVLGLFLTLGLLNLLLLIYYFWQKLL